MKKESAPTNDVSRLTHTQKVPLFFSGHAQHGKLYLALQKSRQRSKLFSRGCVFSDRLNTLERWPWPKLLRCATLRSRLRMKVSSMHQGAWGGLNLGLLLLWSVCVLMWGFFIANSFSWLWNSFDPRADSAFPLAVWHSAFGNTLQVPCIYIATWSRIKTA